MLCHEHTGNRIQGINDHFMYRGSPLMLTPLGPKNTLISCMWESSSQGGSYAWIVSIYKGVFHPLKVMGYMFMNISQT